MIRRTILFAVPLALGLTGLASASSFGSGLGPTFGPASGYQPLVPVSSFARPASWLDPSRLNISTSVSVGTGFNGRTEGLQVTHFSYQLASPLRVSVGLGNAFGSGPGGNGEFFLEGLHLDYRPSRYFNLQVNYQDFRSPLQRNYGALYGYPW